MKIIVIGDIILDINYYVNTKKKAQEADIPIYNVYDNIYILGGAGNVIKNLKNLDNEIDIEIISIIGNDIYGNKIKELLDNNNIKHKIIIDNDRITTQKYRLIHNDNIINRFDIENTNDINKNIEDDIYNYIINKNNIDCIIISDYNKGIITNDLCINIINYCNKNKIYSFVDPKINNINKYKNCFCIKPNLNEGINIANTDDINNILYYISDNLNIKNILLTCSEKGMYLYEKNTISYIYEKYNFENKDVTGAGDIVLSVLVYYYLKTKDLFKSSQISNFIANKSISYIGNYNIKKDDIIYYELKKNNVLYENEINKINCIKNNYNNIVFTNGCFDVFHLGHLKLLNYCKNKGDVLIVGLNSDDSIKKNKGNTRPINNIINRIEFLKNLNIIDYIIIFDNISPLSLLKILKPKILIKGGDYKRDNIIGKEHVEEILIFNYINDISSTKIINIIKNDNN